MAGQCAGRGRRGDGNKLLRSQEVKRNVPVRNPIPHGSMWCRATASDFRSSGWHGWIGLLLIAIFWPLNWFLPGLRTHLLFFPLWLGYILTVDALVLHRSPPSLLARSPRDFVMLFIVSAPVWWLFEALNWRTANWEYLGRQFFSNTEYFLLASVNFSIVIPAVFSTAELMGTFDWIDRFAHGPRVRPTPRLLWGLFLTGWAMLGLLLIWPHAFYPFVWTSVFFILEPVNVWLGKRSILSGLQRGDWRTVAALATGVLVAGFFWEMWNSFSYPKWVYHVPFFGFWHIFEMSLPGFLGYVPFALELYVVAHLLLPRPPQLRFHRSARRALHRQTSEPGHESLS